jgi:hypothetical protein
VAYGEDYLRLVGRVSNFAKQTTGASLVDAYFGPEEFSPDRAETPSNSEQFLAELNGLLLEVKEIDDELRRVAITSDLESFKVVVKWLSGESMPYSRLVEGLFGITPIKFSEREVHEAQQSVDDASAELPGSDVADRIRR